MPPVWLCPESGGAWSHFSSVVDAVKHLNANGVQLLATQVSRSASKAARCNGWCFRSSPSGEDDPAPPEGQDASPPVSSPSSVQAGLSTFFTSSSELPTSGCCKEKLLGDIVVCPGCNQRVHALCKEGAKCFTCVCRMCDSPPGDVMRPCKSSMHRVHDACGMMHAPSPWLTGLNVYARPPSQSPRNQLHWQRRNFGGILITNGKLANLSSGLETG